MTYSHDNLQKLERFLRQVKQNTERSYYKYGYEHQLIKDNFRCPDVNAYTCIFSLKLARSI